MSRSPVVRKKLLDIGETVGHLRSWFPITVERLDRDVMLRWAVEHGLHLAAESLFDAGNHILAAEFQEAPDEYREIPRGWSPGALSRPRRRRGWRACPGFETFSFTTTRQWTF